MSSHPTKADRSPWPKVYNDDCITRSGWTPRTYSVTDSPQDSAASTRSSTPRPPVPRSKDKPKARANGKSGKKTSQKQIVVTCDSDIEPDNLIPEYIETKKKMLELERNAHRPDGQDFDKDLAMAKAEARLARIENDVLFDRYPAEQQWRQQRVSIEKDIASIKKEQKDDEEEEKKEALPENADSKANDEDDEINEEAQRIAAEILAENDSDDDIGGLFDSLPQNEVDESTGKTQTVVTSSDGKKVVIRDFGKWSGVNPQRVLEEACRARYRGPHLLYFALYRS